MNLVLANNTCALVDIDPGIEWIFCNLFFTMQINVMTNWQYVNEADAHQARRGCE